MIAFKASRHAQTLMARLSVLVTTGTTGKDEFIFNTMEL